MNIMFRTKTKQLIFIDYDYSKVVQEDVGFKSRSNFSGSAIYCSKEMGRAINYKEIVKYIDLYYNDVHCLEGSLKEISVFLKKVKEIGG